VSIHGGTLAETATVSPADHGCRHPGPGRPGRASTPGRVGSAGRAFGRSVPGG